MKTEDFGSKFYMGQKVKSFPEVRIHFLYGIWGSAFTILFKRLVQEKHRNGQNEMLKMILQNDLPSMINCKKTVINDDGDDDDDNDEELIVRCMAQECQEESKVVLTKNDQNPAQVDDDNSGQHMDLAGEEIIFGDQKASDTEESPDTDNCDDNAAILLQHRRRTLSENLPDATNKTDIQTKLELLNETTEDEGLDIEVVEDDDDNDNPGADDDKSTLPNMVKKKKKKSFFHQRIRQYSLPKIILPKKSASPKVTTSSETGLQVPTLDSKTSVDKYLSFTWF